ncbi:MAG: FmdE family protein [Methanophagales archaeon]|nr:FmdE family protein [Methanophagales archaeon]
MNKSKIKVKPLLVAIGMSLLLFTVVSVSITAAEYATATRTLPAEPVSAGTAFTVGIEASGYGFGGQVVETLPEGFCYVACTLDPGSVEVKAGLNTVKFTLFGETSFSYTVIASDTAGTYNFSGMLKDMDKNEYEVDGDKEIVVEPGPSPIENLIEKGMDALEVEKGDPDLCVLTDATYVKIEGNTTENYIDLIQNKTGCSIGNGSLLMFHRPRDYPLIIAMFKKGAKANNSYVIALKDGDAEPLAVLTTVPIITKEEREKEWENEYWVNWETSDDAKGNWTVLEGDLGEIGLQKSDAFSITTIASMWGLEAPYDFLRCGEWHNHLCPGVSAGYLITGYIQQNYPLKRGEKYVWITCPPWCKDDAVQTLLDLTPGKRSMFVKQLLEEQEAELPADIAGIIVKWNETENKGTGVVLQFNWTEANAVSNLNGSSYFPPSFVANPLFWTSRLKGEWGLMPYLNEPEKFVEMAKEFDVTAEMLNRLKMAGINPYVEIGMIEGAGSAMQETPENSAKAASTMVAEFEIANAGSATATRTLPAEPVPVGKNFTVTIVVSDYGMFGAVYESLPNGFCYLTSSLSPIQVRLFSETNTVRFALWNEASASFTYTVKAPDTEGTYNFSGILKDEYKNESVVGGDTEIVIAPAQEPSTIENLIEKGMDALEVEKGDPDLCVLTDATYVKIEGNTTENYIDLIQNKTGCSIGKGNLLMFHRPTDYQLIIAMFKKGAKANNSYVIALKERNAEPKAVLTTVPIITKEEREEEWESEYWVNWETSADAKGNWTALEGDFGEIGLTRSDAFSITTIASIWSLDAPYDFLKCSEWHNHICPGVSAGYLITGYIQQNYPLKRGEKYIWIACPPWCKDDAIQTLLDLTPGKRSMFVKQLSEEQEAELPAGTAGILVKWNETAGNGTGVVVQFNWTEANAVSNLNGSSYFPPGFTANPLFWTSRLKGDWGLMLYLDSPEKFVEVAKEFDVTSEMLSLLEMAGVNPYVEIGMMGKTTV